MTNMDSNHTETRSQDKYTLAYQVVRSARRRIPWSAYSGYSAYR